MTNQFHLVLLYQVLYQVLCLVYPNSPSQCILSYCSGSTSVWICCFCASPGRFRMNTLFLIQMIHWSNGNQCPHNVVSNNGFVCKLHFGSWGEGRAEGFPFLWTSLLQVALDKLKTPSLLAIKKLGVFQITHELTTWSDTYHKFWNYTCQIWELHESTFLRIIHMG